VASIHYEGKPPSCILQCAQARYCVIFMMSSTATPKIHQTKVGRSDRPRGPGGRDEMGNSHSSSRERPQLRVWMGGSGCPEVSGTPFSPPLLPRPGFLQSREEENFLVESVPRHKTKGNDGRFTGYLRDDRAGGRPPRG